MFGQAIVLTRQSPPKHLRHMELFGHGAYVNISVTDEHDADVAMQPDGAGIQAPGTKRSPSLLRTATCVGQGPSLVQPCFSESTRCQPFSNSRSPLLFLWHISSGVLQRRQPHGYLDFHPCFYYQHWLLLQMISCDVPPSSPTRRCIPRLGGNLVGGLDTH